MYFTYELNELHLVAIQWLGWFSWPRMWTGKISQIDTGKKMKATWQSAKKKRADIVLLTFCKFVVDVVVIWGLRISAWAAVARISADEEKCTKGTKKAQFYVPDWNRCLGWRGNFRRVGVDEHGSAWEGLPAPMNRLCFLVFKTQNFWFKDWDWDRIDRGWMHFFPDRQDMARGRFLPWTHELSEATQVGVWMARLSKGVEVSDLSANNETLYWNFFSWDKMLEFEFQSCWVGSFISWCNAPSTSDTNVCNVSALNIVEPFRTLWNDFVFQL